MSLNYQQILVTIWFDLFKRLNADFFGSKSTFPDSVRKLESHRTSLFLECIAGGWGLVRNAFNVSYSQLSVSARKDPELSSLLWLLENEVPLTLSYYSCIWLSKNVTVWRHANKRMWLSFFVYGRKNSIKLPLLMEGLLEQMSVTDAPLYRTFCETNIWVDDWYNEHRMCIRRPAFNGLNTPEKHRRAAFIQDHRRSRTSSIGPRLSKNSLSDDTINNYKARTTEFLDASILLSIFRR